MTAQFKYFKGGGVQTHHPFFIARRPLEAMASSQYSREIHFEDITERLTFRHRQLTR